MRTLNTPIKTIWRQALLVGLTTLAAASCTPSATASSTTTTTQPPTTTTSSTTTTTQPPTTTTSSTTTTTTTSVPPPTAAPVDPAVAEINQRLDTLWPARNACLSDPTSCDIDGLIAEYATPDSVAARAWRNQNDTVIAANIHAINLDKIEAFVASVDVTGNDAITEVCYRDGATAVNADGSIVDDTINLYRFEWIWSKIDGRWMIVGGQHYQIGADGSAICDAYFQ